ncbi:MAG: hypothetical protein A3F13_06785 [Gammaproteobacteria bacterium RIFCSPHIGHO2_12_FULL_40_19]|nr:MAG: hypothetical protein A3F13_06785 [Gammaproteobacteria bacterium RIFCSPHIGHO2_12_FULL_40_19]
MFGTIENLKNPNYLCELIQPILSDIASLVANGISLGGDSYNLCIKNEEYTSEIVKKYDTFTPNKKLKLYFYDFSNKCADLFPFELCSVLDKKDEPDISIITQQSLIALNRTIDSIIDTFSKNELALLGITEHDACDVISNIYINIRSNLIETITDQVIRKLNENGLNKTTETLAPLQFNEKIQSSINENLKHHMLFSPPVSALNEESSDDSDDEYCDKIRMLSY